MAALGEVAIVASRHFLNSLDRIKPTPQVWPGIEAALDELVVGAEPGSTPEVWVSGHRCGCTLSFGGVQPPEMIMR